ncbi:hypothetical protein Avbf_08654, partial [Armadillidium vulgare]
MIHKLRGLPLSYHYYVFIYVGNNVTNFI